MSPLLQDIRYALRMLRKSPGFAIVAVATLALAIGANTSIFSVVSAVLLRPLPWADSDRIVFLTEGPKGARAAGQVTSTSYDNYSDWERQSASFEAMALYDGWSPALTGIGTPERIKAALVTSGLFDVFRVVPALGRAMRPEENRAGSPNVIVVSHGFWQRRLGADPNAVGRVVQLNGSLQTIIGVLPAGFRAPLDLDAELWSNTTPDPRDTRGSRSMQAVGRLKPGVTLAQARAEMRAISERLEAAYPRENKGQEAIVTPVRDALSSDTRGPLVLLLGASALVLLIACANLSNLLIARGVARSGEFAIRAALGATRRRAIRQLLTESALLSGAGAAAGVLLAPWATDLLVRLGPASLRQSAVRMDWRVLAFALTVTVITAILFGLVPALRFSRADIHSTLKEGGRSGGRTIAARTRSALAVAQLGLALTLLVLAGLLVKSFETLQRVDPGIEPRGLLTAALNLPDARYPAARRPVFFEELIGRVGSLPGVRSAAVASVVPFSGDWDRIAVATEEMQPRPTSEWPEADRYIVSAGYFATMKIPVKSGRLLEEQDRDGTPAVAVVDEVFARKLSPSGAAIGQRIFLPMRTEPATVVGIVGHVKHYGLDASSGGQVYMSHRQYPWRWMRLVVRSSVPSETLVAPVTAAVRALDPDIPIYAVSSMESYMAERTATRRFSMLLLAVFAGVAATLAAIGLFGVIAYTVSHRVREIAIRMALGARSADVVRMVLKQGAWLAAAGVALGLAGALAGARLVSGMLFGVGQADPAVFGGVAVLLFALAIAASYIPARRAATISPMEALRNE